MVNNNLHI